MRRILVMLLLVFCAAPALAQGVSDDVRSMFDEANALMTRADEAATSDPKLSGAIAAQAAALYRSCIERGGIDNADLHADLGNAELRAGNVGLAIVSYRRAERLDPRNPIARAGLNAARSGVSVIVDPDAPKFAIDALFIWRRWVPRSLVFGVGVIAWLGLWGTLGARAAGLWRPPAGLIAACAACALLTLGGQYAEQRTLYNGRHAVVTAREIVGRNGPNAAAYQPTFADPLVEGVECVLLERREGWAHVRLDDGRTTWLPDAALETI